MARQTREHRHKKKIVRTLIVPTVLYGCETRTMTKKNGKKDQRMRDVDMEEDAKNIMDIEEDWMGHLLRGDSLQREIMEGRMEGKRGRGRPRQKLLDWMMS